MDISLPLQICQPDNEIDTQITEATRRESAAMVKAVGTPLKAEKSDSESPLELRSYVLSNIVSEPIDLELPHGKKAGVSSSKQTGGQKTIRRESASTANAKGAVDTPIEVEDEEHSEDNDPIGPWEEESDNEGGSQQADDNESAHERLEQRYNVLVHHQIFPLDDSSHEYNHTDIIEITYDVILDQLKEIVKSGLPSTIMIEPPQRRGSPDLNVLPELMIVWQDSWTNIPNFQLTDDYDVERGLQMMFQRGWIDHIQAKWNEPELEARKVAKASGSRKRKIVKLEEDVEDEREENSKEQSESDQAGKPKPPPKKKKKTENHPKSRASSGRKR